MGPLYVVAAVFNPIRFASRHRLYLDFAKRVQDAGAILYTVEAAFGDRPHAVTQEQERHIQVRTDSELWLKENLWQVGISRLPASAEYVATVDADLAFARPDWAEETVHQLQHHRVVQMFSNISHLGPDHVALSTSPSFAFMHVHDNAFFGRLAKIKGYAKMVQHAVPGGAWAYRREELSKVGGLIDEAILGSADMYMGMALVGRGEQSVAHREFHPDYKRMVTDWEKRADRWLRRDVGYVSGTVLHGWHGKMNQRGYGVRDEILVKHQFSPAKDIKRDHQGLIHLDDDGSLRFVQFRDDLRSYFRSRNEDSIDV